MAFISHKSILTVELMIQKMKCNASGDRQEGGITMATPFIMLVDDEATFVETTAKRLDVRNIETLSAFSGEECLETLKTNQTIDVIVLDVKMPGMDGLETLKRIKNESPLGRGDYADWTRHDPIGNRWNETGGL